MNKRMIAYVLGLLLVCEAGLLLLPVAVALIYSEPILTSFFITIGVLLVSGLILMRLKPKDKTIFAKDGLFIVALGWIFLSLFGALPFYLSREIPSYLDALFETVSGFTTTGASILSDVEALSKSLLFWRSFTHWIGGMGVLVFVMAVLPLSGGGGDLHLMRAESPGPSVGKLVPRSNKTARILYGIYLAMTVIQIVLLLIGGMPLFDSITISFGTAGTGGFGILNNSIASYNTFCQAVITVFMALFGINFNVYFLIMIKNFKGAFKSEELWGYLGIMGSAILAITINIRGHFDSILEALHHAAFQVSSVMTTTGYTTTDFDKWPELSKTILIMIMCIGACAGSTGGGFKVSRVLLLLKYAKKTIHSYLHPRSVKVITFDGQRVANETFQGTVAFFIVYIIIFAVSLLIVSADKHDLVTDFSGVVATFNNIGPGLGKVGPTGNFSSYSALSKIVFIIDMLLGRLEIFPLICLFAPSIHKKHFRKKL